MNWTEESGQQVGIFESRIYDLLQAFCQEEALPADEAPGRDNVNIVTPIGSEPSPDSANLTIHLLPLLEIV